MGEFWFAGTPPRSAGRDARDRRPSASCLPEYDVEQPMGSAWNASSPASGHFERGIEHNVVIKKSDGLAHRGDAARVQRVVAPGDPGRPLAVLPRGMTNRGVSPLRVDR